MQFCDDHLARFKAVIRRRSDGDNEEMVSNKEYQRCDFGASKAKSKAAEKRAKETGSLRAALSNPDLLFPSDSNTVTVEGSDRYVAVEGDGNEAELDGGRKHGKKKNSSQSASTKRKIADLGHKLASRQYMKTRLANFHQSYYKEFNDDRDGAYKDPWLHFEVADQANGQHCGQQETSVNGDANFKATYKPMVVRM